MEVTNENRTDPYQPEDMHTLLSLDPVAARKMFVSQGTGKGQLDDVFTKNLRNLSMLYEALQNSLSRLEDGGNTSYPSVQELSRYLAIYKRSIADRSSMLSETEFLRNALILAGQEPPFIHILRKAVSTEDGINFQARFAAPTKDNLDKVSKAYENTISECSSVLRQCSDKVFWTKLLHKLRHSLESLQPEVRIGRVDYLLHKCRIDENLLGIIPYDLKGYAKRVNETIHKRIYTPIILSGIRSRFLVSFNCKNMFQGSIAQGKNSYEIVHFASSDYLEQRYSILTNYLSSSFFGEWWDREAGNFLQHSLDIGEINKEQWEEGLQQALLNKINKNPDSVPPHLVHLLLETIKLREWLLSYQMNAEQERKQAELNSLIRTLKKANTFYQIRNKQWLTENIEVLIQILRGNVPGLLGCTDPYIAPYQIAKDFNFEGTDTTAFFILKDKKAAVKAVQTAVELYENNKNSFLLHVLENLLRIRTEKREELKKYIAPLYLNTLEELLHQSYLNYLSWWSRVLLFLSRKNLSLYQMQKIRETIEEKNRKAVERSSQKNKNLEYLDLQESKENFPSLSQRPTVFQTAQSPEEKKLIDKCCAFLDRNWDQKQYPVRRDLLSMAGAQGDLMNKILSFVHSDALSVRSIAAIFVNGVGDIYASRNYLLRNRSRLIKTFADQSKEKESITIDEKSYLTTNQRGKNLSTAVLRYLKNDLRS